MANFDVMANRDANWRSSGGSGTSTIASIGEYTSNKGVMMMTFPTINIPAGEVVTKAEIVLRGSGYAEGNTSGTLIFRALSSPWSEQEFAPNYNEDIASFGWSGAMSDSEHVFDITAWASTGSNAQRLWAGHGLGIWFTPNGLIGIFTRESSNQRGPRLRITTAPNRTPNAPTVSISGIGSDNQWTNASQLTINWSFSDPDSGDYQTAYQVVGSTNNFASYQYNSGEVANGTARSVTTPQLAEGTWRFAVRTRDRYGAWSGWGYSVNVRIDRTKPTIGSVSDTQYTNGSGPVRIWAYNVTDNWSGVNRVAVTMVRPDGSTYNGGNATQSGNNWYTDVTWTGEIGTWGIRFQAYDNAGNASDPKQATVIHDRTPPTIGSTYPEQMYSNVAVNGTFRVRADNVTDDRSGVSNVRFAVWTEAGGQDDLKWYDAISAGGNNWYYDVPINQHGNAEGKYIIHTYAYDRAGNNSSKGTEKWVDRTPPTNATPQGYSYTRQTSGTYRVWFNGVTDSITGIGGTSASVTRPDNTNTGLTAYVSGNNYYVDVPLSTMQGEYTVYFQSQDRAGNRSGTVYAKFFLDSVWANDPNPNVTYTDRSATFTWNAFSDPAPSSGRKTTDFYLGEWNGSSYVGPMLYNGTDIGNVTSFVVNNLKPGTRYRYTVTYHDNAGNESLYTYKEFVTKRIVGYCRVRTAANETTSFPLYDPKSGVLGEKTVRISLGGGVVGCFELVPVNDPKAGRLHISTPNGIRAAAK